MGMKVGKGGNLQNDPNVVPFIDILLVLLVIFMLMQPLSRQAFDVQVPPPKEQEQEEQQQQEQTDQIVLEIMQDGSYQINGEPVVSGGLDARIHQIYDNRPAKLIFIKAHESRLYQEVITAMDIVKTAGVQIIGFTPAEAAAAAEGE